MAPPRLAPPAALEPPAARTPGFWRCPRCIYRIALVVDDVDDAIAQHVGAHTFADLGRPHTPTPGRLRPDVRR